MVEFISNMLGRSGRICGDGVCLFLPRLFIVMLSSLEGVKGNTPIEDNVQLKMNIQNYYTYNSAGIAIDKNYEIIDKYGHIEDWDVSRINDMNGAFQKVNTNYDLSKWDTSSVTDMQYSKYKFIT